jgi:hypothetical protein
MQATDTDVVGWVTAAYRRRSGGDDPGTGPEDISVIIDLAIEQVHGHGAQHLLTAVSGWPIAGGDDFLITVDLASGIRLCTRCISRRQLLQPLAEAVSAPGSIEAILANTLAAARHLLESYPRSPDDHPEQSHTALPGTILPPAAWILRRDDGRDETLSLHGSSERALAVLAEETRSRWDNLAGYMDVPRSCDRLSDAQVVDIYYQRRAGLEWHSIREENIDVDTTRGP